MPSRDHAEMVDAGTPVRRVTSGVDKPVVGITAPEYRLIAMSVIVIRVRHDGLNENTVECLRTTWRGDGRTNRIAAREARFREMGTVTPLVAPRRRIRTETTFEFSAGDRPAALAALKASLDVASHEHPQIRSHTIVESNGEIDIVFELELNSSADPQQIVLDLIDTAVASMGGRITQDDGAVVPGPQAVFEQRGTYLVPA